MSELQAYYDAFRTGQWAVEDASVCLCHGSGWALSEVDTWHKCPIHYVGQLDPAAYDFLGPTDPDGTEDVWAADLESRTEWAVKRGFASSLKPAAPVEAPIVWVEDEFPF